MSAKFLKIFAVAIMAVGLTAGTAVAQDVYVITGSLTQFTAKKDGVIVPPADEFLQLVINGIKADAAGKPCVIQFGSGGTDTLKIGTANVVFDGGVNGDEWGEITLTGGLSSSASDTSSAAVAMNNGVSVNSSAIIVNTVNNRQGIRNNSVGALTVSGGRVSATTAIHNNSTGSVTISGGTVSATIGNGRAVYNYSTGSVTVSGGSADYIINNSTGAVTVSDGTVNTITNYSAGTVTVSGGSVRSINNHINSTGAVTVSDGTVNTIENYFNGTVTISGGTIGSVTAYEGNAGNATGSITINGGTIRSVSSSSNGTVRISGGTVSGIGIGSTRNTRVIISGNALVTSADASDAIRLSGNGNAGAIIVEGGIVENTGSGSAILNVSRGEVTISGGTVSATTGSAIRNENTGRITVSGNALVTSASTSGTISQADGYSASITVGGGTVENTASGSAIRNFNVTISGGTVSATSGNAISGGAQITISGGTVSATTGNAVYTNSNAPITIRGGAVSTTTGYAVHNGNGGVLTISGGTVSATTGVAIVNNHNENYPNRGGETRISGGTVSATTGRAINNYSAGKITISGNALVTSSNPYDIYGTIILANVGTATTQRLVIEGGTVENTSGNAVRNNSTGSITISGGVVSAAGGNAVLNNSTGSITISGGAVSAADGDAVLNGSRGALTISGGMISATTGKAVNNIDTVTAALSGGFLFAYGTGNSDVISGKYTRPTNSTVTIVAWDQAAGNTEYAAQSSADLAAWPSTASAVWDTQDDTFGISYANGTNTGFFPFNVTNVGGTTGIVSNDRVIYQITPDNGAAVVLPPVNVTAFEITVGPNPVRGSDGVVNVFITGKRIDDGTLTVFDATGNVVKKITITDNAMIGNIGRRVVGSWDLKDGAGRPVSDGAYLLRGTVKTADGKRERVSVIIGVR